LIALAIAPRTAPPILHGGQPEPEYLALNPAPSLTLVHDGAVVVESTVICEYLDEASDKIRRRCSSARVCGCGRRPSMRSCIRFARRSRMWSLIATRQRRRATSGEVARGAASAAGRLAKRQWIKQGIDAPGAADKIRLYDAYLRKMGCVGGVRVWSARAFDGR
jgi:glutathione S-transferase